MGAEDGLRERDAGGDGLLRGAEHGGGPVRAVEAEKARDRMGAEHGEDEDEEWDEEDEDLDDEDLDDEDLDDEGG